MTKIVENNQQGTANIADDRVLCPVVIKSCHCKQCRYVKNKRKNRKLKKKIKRWLNKQRRNEQYDGRCSNHYWA